MTGEGLRLEKKHSQRNDREGVALGHQGMTFPRKSKWKTHCSEQHSLYDQVLLVVAFCC